MLQIRIHGRGGQGVVTAAEMLSIAAFEQGRYAQAFPSFGSERTGAPVVAFCRIDDREIRLREPILAPDVLIIQDPTLLHQVDVFQGLDPEGYVLINSRRSFDELGLGEVARRLRRERLITVPASDIAVTHLGRPLPNAAVDKAIHAKFKGRIGDANVAAAGAAFAFVKSLAGETTHAQAG
jgi:pyruvate ferredoxin oxidoreductase gamma subunit